MENSHDCLESSPKRDERSQFVDEVDNLTAHLRRLSIHPTPPDPSSTLAESLVNTHKRRRSDPDKLEVRKLRKRCANSVPLF